MITLPYSLELGIEQDSRSVVQGDSHDPVDRKIKVYIGEKVNPKKRQSIVGVLKGLAAHMDAVNSYYWADYLSGSAGNFQKGTTFGAANTDICIIVGDNVNRSSSREINETLDQIVNVLVENIVDHYEFQKHNAVSSAYIRISGTADTPENTHAINLNERKSFNDVLFLWVAYQKVSDGQEITELEIGGRELTLAGTVKPDSAAMTSLYLDLWTMREPTEGRADLKVTFAKAGQYYTIYGGVFSDIGEMRSVLEREQAATDKVIIEDIEKHVGSIIFAGGSKDNVAGDEFIPEPENAELINVSAQGALHNYIGAARYQIIFPFNDRLVQVEDGSDSDKANINTAVYNSANPPLWDLVARDDGYFSIQTSYNSKAMTAECTNGSCNVFQWSYTGADTQLWAISSSEGYHVLINKHYGSRMSYNPGGNVSVAVQSNNPDQLWYLRREGENTSVGSFLNTIPVSFNSINAGSTAPNDGTLPPKLSALITVESKVEPKSVESRPIGGGGKEWAPVLRGANSGATDETCYGLATDEEGVVVAVFDHGFASRSEDNGKTWAPLARGLGQPEVNTDWWRVDTDKKHTWVAVGQDGKASRSEDNGLTWVALPDWISTGGSTGTITSARYIGNKTWIACASSSYCSRSIDNGLTWESIGRGLGGVVPNNGGPIDFATNFRGVVVAGCNAGFAARSEDYGETWVQLTRGLNSGDSDNHIYTVCTNRYGLWFAGMAQGYAALSVDEGKTWAALPKGLNATSSNFAINSCISDGRGILIAVFVEGYASISEDWGKTWTALPQFLNSNVDGVSGFRIITDRKGRYLAAQSSASIVQSPPPAYAQWGPLKVGLNSGAPETSHALSVCTDENGVWVVGFLDGFAARSFDNGLNWYPINLDIDSSGSHINCIACDKQGVWVAGFSSGHAARSEDNGLTWTSLPLGLNSGSTTDGINSIETDEKGVWIASMQSGYASRSSDGAEIWVPLLRGLNNGGTGDINALATNRQGNWVSYGAEGRASVSHDNGVHWSTLPAGLNAGLITDGLTLSANGHIFISGAAAGMASRSSDNGNTWNPLPKNLGSDSINGSSINEISTNGGTYFFSVQEDGYSSYSSDLGLSWYSMVKGLNSGERSNGIKSIGSVERDGGTSIACMSQGFAAINPPITSPTRWAMVPNIPEGDSVRVSAIAYKNNTIYISYANFISARSPDNGKTWERLDDGMGTGRQILKIETGIGDNVFAFCSISVASRSTDGGLTWTLMENYFSFSATHNVTCSATLNMDEGYVFAAFGNGNVRMSEDSGRTWKSIRDRLDLASVGNARVDTMATDHKNVVIMTSGVLARRSTDSGKTWSHLPLALNSGSDTALLDLSTDEKGNWVAISGTGHASRSVDNGLNWTPLPYRLGAPPPNNWLMRSLCLNNLGEQSVFLVIDRNGGISASSDSGASWFIVERIGHFIHSFLPAAWSASNKKGNVLTADLSGKLASSPPIFTRPLAVPDLVVSPGNSSLALSWNTPGSPDLPLTGYLVYWRSLAAQEWETDSIGLTTSFTISGLNTGESYICKVAALCDLGHGDDSNVISGIPN